MPAVNQFNGFGGTSGFNNWPNMTQPYAAVPQKPLYDPSKANGDCLKQVNGAQSAAQYAQLQQLGLTIGNQNYETAQQIYGLQTNLMNQNNTNLINAIQGFNQINQNITAQGAGIMEAIQRLGYQMDQCCCSIKTQMLQDRLADAQADLVTANGQISNANQTQTILNTMGKWVANPAATTA